MTTSKPSTQTNIQCEFSVGYMDYSERKSMQEKPVLGCWYCGIKKCYLTHKYDDYSKAKYKERNPYIHYKFK